jgi:hypothetical protein
LFSPYGAQLLEQRVQFVTVKPAEPFTGYPAVHTQGIDFAPVCRVNIEQLHLVENGAALLTQYLTEIVVLIRYAHSFRGIKKCTWTNNFLPVVQGTHTEFSTAHKRAVADNLMPISVQIDHGRTFHHPFLELMEFHTRECYGLLAGTLIGKQARSQRTAHGEQRALNLLARHYILELNFLFRYIRV